MSAEEQEPSPAEEKPAIEDSVDDAGGVPRRDVRGDRRPRDREDQFFVDVTEEMSQGGIAILLVGK